MSASTGTISPSKYDHPWLANYPNTVSWSAPIETRPVADLLDRAARDFPNRPATSFKGKVKTYAETQRRVNTIAAGLQSLGVGKGVKVGLFLPNTPAFVEYYFAILKAGGTVVNFNPLYTIDELTFQVRDSDTDIMVTHDLKVLATKLEQLIVLGVLRRAVLVPFAPQLPATTRLAFRTLKRAESFASKRSPSASAFITEQSMLRAAKPLQPVAIDVANDIAVLQYTGGTTGTPKGAMLTHANVYANTRQIELWAGELRDGQETVLGVLPFFHVFAMTVVLNLTIAKASKIVMIPRFQLDEAMRLIDKEKPTMMPAVPTIFNAIIHHPKLANFELSSLRFCISGGAPLPLEIKQQFEALTGCKVVEGYGLSEASPVVTCNPIEGPVIPGSIGPPLPGTIISLRSVDDPAIEVERGQPGELCVAGPQVMKGYWKRPDETANQFAGRFLRTGDVAIMDDNGYFSIVDRIKDLIICSGFNVYPRHIEEAIYTHPAVEEVTVIGIKDAYRGETPKAFIKLRSGASATADAILKHLSSKISRYEMPTAIEFRDSLPKTMIGKLSKKELAAEEAAKPAKSTVGAPT